MKKILLIGGGGHCSVIIDAILEGKSFTIAGIIDGKRKIGEKLLGVEVVGNDLDLVRWFNKNVENCFIAVGSVGNPDFRMKLYSSARKIGFSFPNIIHPEAVVSKFAELGHGNYIGANSVINAGARVGNNCIINTGAIIEHDCSIGDFVHISPGVTVCGGVSIGSAAHLGANSVVIQCLKIGRRTLIGAGSVVLKNIGDSVVAFGNPCKKIKKNET